MASEGERRHDDALSVAALRRTLAATGLLRSGIAGRDEEDDRLLLLRFLRARKMDVAKAAAMWEAMIRWRDQMEEVLAAGAAGEFPLRPEEIQIAREFHPRGYHGVDKGGRPLYIELLGNSDPQKLLEAISLERYVAHRSAEAEHMQITRIPACSLAFGSRIEAQMVVIDVAGIGMKNFNASARQLLGAIQHVLGQFYPETLHSLYIINASRSFRFVWAWIRPFLDPATVARIHILGHDYTTTLLEVVDADQLPSFLGGKCTCPGDKGGCIWSDKGPWNDAAILERLGRLRPNKQTPPVMSSPLSTYSFSSKVLDLQQRIAAAEAEHAHIKMLLKKVLSKQDEVLNILQDLGVKQCRH